MTKDEAEKIYIMHKELIALACIESTCNLPSEERRIRWRRKEKYFKRYLESLIEDCISKPNRIDL